MAYRWRKEAAGGVSMSSTCYDDLSALVEAARKQDCSVHLHVNDQGRNVFSVGNSNIGAREFSTYAEALAWVDARAAQ